MADGTGVEQVTLAKERGKIHGAERDYLGLVRYPRRTDFPSGSFPPYVEFSIQEDYLNARNRFQKGYTSISGEPGYFYFKVIFDFKGSPLLRNNIIDAHLHGNRGFKIQVKDPSYDFISAEKFLLYNSRRAQCAKRYQALRRFLDLLYYISEDTPWAIRSVQGLGESIAVDFNQLASQEKKFNIQFSEETLDFRLTLLNDLYRFACFDVHNQRIIVPENLRKFNMSIIFFSVPIRWWQTPIKSGYLGDTLNNALQETRNLFGNLSSVNKSNTLKDKNNPGYKGLDKRTVFNTNKRVVVDSRIEVDEDNTRSYHTIFDDDSDAYNPNESLSVHMLHFRNCEISLKSTYSTFQQGDNQRPFQTAPKWEIEFQRCYQQDVSEWFDLHVGELFQHLDLGKSYGLTIESKIAYAAEKALQEGERSTLIQDLVKNLRGDFNSDESLQQQVQNALHHTKDFFSAVGKQIKSTFNDMFVPRKGGDMATRLRYIKEQKLWGGSSELSSKGLSGMFDRAIDNVISPLNDFITLGNIYDDSWASLMNGLLNSDTAYDMVKTGAGFIGRNAGVNWMTKFGNGGLGAFSDSVSVAAGQALTGNFKGVAGEFEQFWANKRPSEYRTKPFYVRIKNHITPTIELWPSGSNNYIWDDKFQIVADLLKAISPKATKYKRGTDTVDNGWNHSSQRSGMLYSIIHSRDPHKNYDSLTGGRYYPDGNIFNLKGYWRPNSNDESFLQGATPGGLIYGSAWHDNKNEYYKTSQQKRYGMMYMLMRGKNPLIDGKNPLTGTAYYPEGNLFDLTGLWRPRINDNSWLQPYQPGGWITTNTWTNRGGYNGKTDYYWMTQTSKRYGMMPMLVDGINPYITRYYPSGNMFTYSKRALNSSTESLNEGMLYMLYGITNPLIRELKKSNTVFTSDGISPYNKVVYYNEQDPLLATSTERKHLTFSMLYGYNSSISAPKPMIGEQMRVNTPISDILTNPTYKDLLNHRKARKATIDTLYKEDYLIPKDNTSTQPMRGRTSLIDNMYVNNTILAAQQFENSISYNKRTSTIENMYEQDALISSQDKESTTHDLDRPSVLSQNYRQSTVSDNSSIKDMYEYNNLIRDEELQSTVSDKEHVKLLNDVTSRSTERFKNPVKVLSEESSESTKPFNNRKSSEDLLYRLNTLLESDYAQSTDLKKEVIKLLDKYSSESTTPNVDKKRDNIITTYYK